MNLIFYLFIVPLGFIGGTVIGAISGIAEAWKEMIDELKGEL